MANKGILEKALAQQDLLTQVAKFKRTFYPIKWAQYECARIGTLKLVLSSTQYGKATLRLFTNESHDIWRSSKFR